MATLWVASRKGLFRFDQGPDGWAMVGPPAFLAAPVTAPPPVVQPPAPYSIHAVTGPDGTDVVLVLGARPSEQTSSRSPSSITTLAARPTLLVRAAVIAISTNKKARVARSKAARVAVIGVSDCPLGVLADGAPWRQDARALVWGSNAPIWALLHALRTRHDDDSC